MTFQLDTSGVIDMRQNETVDRGDLISWSDLSPFAQGYVEAMFAELSRQPVDHEAAAGGWFDGFSDLAPETLTRIIADCASFDNVTDELDQKAVVAEGQSFWTGRQGGLSGAFGAAFPPLTVQLGDDGKVRFAA